MDSESRAYALLLKAITRKKQALQAFTVGILLRRDMRILSLVMYVKMSQLKEIFGLMAVLSRGPMTAKSLSL